MAGPIAQPPVTPAIGNPLYWYINVLMYEDDRPCYESNSSQHLEKHRNDTKHGFFVRISRATNATNGLVSFDSASRKKVEHGFYTGS